MNNTTRLFGAKIKNLAGETKFLKVEDRSATSVIVRLLDDPTITDVLSVKPFDSFDAFVELASQTNPIGAGSW